MSHKILSTLIVVAVLSLMLYASFYYGGVLTTKWTDSGILKSINSDDSVIFPTYNITVLTDHHGLVSGYSQCGWELEGNKVYVSELGSGKIVQTDKSGHIICT